MELLTKEQHIEHLQFLQEMLHAKISENNGLIMQLTVKVNHTMQIESYMVFYNTLVDVKKTNEKLLAELRYLVYLEMNLEMLVMLAEGE